MRAKFNFHLSNKQLVEISLHRLLWHNLNYLPIWDGVIPFLPSFLICSLTSSAFNFNHDGTERRYGKADWEIPLLKLKTISSIKIENHLNCYFSEHLIETVNKTWNHVHKKVARNFFLLMQKNHGFHFTNYFNNISFNIQNEKYRKKHKIPWKIE